jgi:hypothetical protein
VFLRLQGDRALLRYAWGEVRKTGQPEGAAFDVNRPIAVVYGENAPNIEMEAAYLLAATIESASGRPVALYSSQDIPAGETGTLIAVGKTQNTAALTIAGYDQAVEFALRYWLRAKDSGARRVGLVKKSLAAGADVANLP